MVKRLPTMRDTRVQSLGQEDLLQKEMATHSSILAWKIPWMEEPGRLQSVGSQGVRHDWATKHSIAHILWKYSEFTVLCCFLMLSKDMGSISEWGRSLAEGNGNSLQYSCLENSMGRGVSQAIVHGIVKSRTQLSD